MQQHGPYYLCGHSFGGLVVYEMAAILAREGEDVGLVALFDAEIPAYGRTLPLRQRIRYYLVYILDRIAKYGRNLFRGRIDRVVLSAVNTCVGWSKKLAWRAAPALFGAMGHGCRAKFVPIILCSRMHGGRIAPENMEVVSICFLRPVARRNTGSIRRWAGGHARLASCSRRARRS